MEYGTISIVKSIYKMKLENIVFTLKEGDYDHSIVYLHNGEVLVALGSTKEEAMDNLYAQVAMKEKE